MKACQRGVKWGIYKLIPKVFNIIVIFGLVLQPVGPGGVYSLALAIESESDLVAPVVEEPALAPDPVEEEAAPAEEPVEEPAPATEPVAEETPAVTPAEVENPVIDSEVAQTRGELVEGNEPVVVPPAEEPAETPAEPGETPATSPEIPVETPATEPVETPVETPADAPAEAPVSEEVSTEEIPATLVEPVTIDVVNPEPVEEETVCLAASVEGDSETNWNVDEDGNTAVTNGAVELGVRYVYPLDREVTVTFTCLPSDESKRAPLKIERIDASDITLPEGVVAATEYAYDITTEGMDNGDFKYDLSLPKSDVEGAEVKFIEQSADEVVASDVTASELKAVDEDNVEEEADSVTVTDLDHFTVFVVTANATVGNNNVGTADNGWVSDNAYAVFDNDSDWVEYGFPDIVVPVGAAVDGIEVLVEGNADSTRDFRVALWNVSNNNPDAYTSTKTANISSSDTTQTLGSPTDKWGETWTPADFADATFKVRVDADNDSGTAYLDHIEVKVYFTESTKDLTATKVNDVSGSVIVDNPFIWTITVTNTGSTSVTFNNQDIFEDDLPSSGVTYSTTSNLPVVTVGGVTGTIDCDISGNTLDCDDNSSGLMVVIPAGGSFSVDVTATPTAAGTLANPRSGGGNVCKVDPDGLVSEFNESNNDCTDSVTVTEPEVDICHATSSQSNPYVANQPNESADVSGHDDHNGPIWFPGIAVTWGDIIPPFDYTGGSYLGKNWTAEGQAIWNNQCAMPTGTIIVHKDVQGPNGEDVTDASNYFEVRLDAGVGQAISDNLTVTYNDVPAGNHTITESLVDSDYTLYGISTAAGQVGTPAGLAVDVAGGQTVDVYVTNRQKSGTITVVKDVVDPNGGPISDSHSFTVNLSPGTQSSSFAEGTNAVFTVNPGTYTASESADPDYTSLGCLTATGKTDIVVASGGAVTITCTNQQTNPTLSIYKVCDPAGDTGLFNLRIDGVNQTTDTVCGGWTNGQIEVTVGSHTVSETGGSGTDLSNYTSVISGDCASDGSITLATGENKSCTITNTRKGKITVTKYSDDNGDGIRNEGEPVLEGWDMHLSQGEPFSADETTDASGNANFDNLLSGSYVLSEPEVEGWTLTNIACSNEEQEGTDASNEHSVSVSAGETVSCSVGNTQILEPVTVIASKIVCTDEADLPNYGPDPGGPGITETTAADWVATHESCELVPDWRFQWSYDGVANPGDNTGEAGSGWNTFGPTGIDGTATVEVVNESESDRLWFREIWNSDYIPFAYGATGNDNDVSAEFYCNGDVVNYDNWDWADTEAGGTYYCVAWNVAQPGKIIVKKQTDPAGSSQAFAFNPSWSQDNFLLADGEQEESATLAPGTYSVTELPLVGWRLDSVACDDQSSPDAISLEPGETVTCTFKNQQTAHIVATKIVCTDEADLPNYGVVGVGPDMTAGTAVDWVNTHESCSFQENWQFQWAYYSDPNPGDNTGESLDPTWHTFGPTGVSGQASADVDLKSSSLLWVREVWDDSSIPFTYGENPEDVNGNDVSAEFYCHQDVQNYDNYDFIDASGNAAAYYCVGWNVPRGDIHGFKWDDQDGNGEIGEGEEKLAGWRIFIDENGNEAFDEGEPYMDTSDGEEHFGWYWFENLFPGEYSVCEVSQDGWDQTYPVNYDEEEETASYCHTVILPDGNSGGFPETQNAVFGPEYNFGNQFVPPVLRIFKLNDSGSPETPGNSVLYTITVTAPESNTTDVEDVQVTDLPPAGFTYVDGSATASQGGLTHVYASPGVWSLGTMTPGQTITLSYQATISGTQDAGTYNDLAFAQGKSIVNETDVPDVTANSPDPFVGTDVEVAIPETPSTVIVPEDNEHEIKEKTVKKTKYVLGASTLPYTGASINTILFALMTLLGGLILMLLSKRSTWLLIRSFSKSMTKVFLFAVVAGGILFAGQSVSAAPGDLNVQIEQPQAVTDSPEFKVGFVVLDISADDPIDVECEVAYEAGTFGEFDTYTIAAGGTSGDCVVHAADMPADGTYTFRVTAEEQVGTDSAVATAVPIEFVTTLPGVPYDYDRNDASCMNNITFMTASDAGKTVKVELYRSLSTSFAADAGTFVADQAIGSGTSGAFSVAAPGCSNDYFYAIRAVDTYGFSSAFVGDVDRNVDTDTVTHTSTTVVETAGAAPSGAIAVTPAAEGTVEGAATTSEEEAVTPAAAEEAEQGGTVLGAMTEKLADLWSWISEHPWWTALWILILIALGYYAYQTYLRKHNEDHRPR